MERQSAVKTQKSPSRSNHVSRSTPQSQTHSYHLLTLQSSLGNHLTQRLIGSFLVQTKLQISQPEDPFEREAESVADTVMRMRDQNEVDNARVQADDVDVSPDITRLQRVALPADEAEETKTENEEIQRVPVAVTEDDEEEKIAPVREDETAEEESDENLQLISDDNDLDEVEPEQEVQTIQAKCAADKCEEDEQTETGPALQREPAEVTDEEEEETQVALLPETDVSQQPELQVETQPTVDLPLRRQSKDDELTGESVPVTQEQGREAQDEKIQTKAFVSSFATQSSVQRMCDECEEEKEQEQQEPIQRLTEPEIQEAKPVANDLPIQRQSKGDDERPEETTPEPAPIQRQTDDEEELAPLQRVQVTLPKPAPHSVQRLCNECESEEKQLQRDATHAQPVRPAINNSVAATVRSLDGTGRPLSNDSRAFFEPRFGVDFSQVRIHTDTRAVQTARAINARAFTFGRNIAFGAGEYSPDTDSGKHVLAHELTHVVQQGATSQQTEPAPEVSKIHRLTSKEQVDRGVEVYDLLDGWTSSQDSADILSKFQGLPGSDVNAILNASGLHASMTVIDIYKWLHDDMVGSDWKELMRIFIKTNTVDVSEVIGYVVVNDYLEGWTSADDSKEVVEYLSAVSGTMLDNVIAAMETKAGKKSTEMADYLFGELQEPDQMTLSQTFLTTGSVKAIEYSTYYYASKIKNLLTGFTGIRDSNSILQNFQRAGGKGEKADTVSQIAVLTKLDELTKEGMGKSAEDALMQYMQQEDYNSLQKMLPQNLHVYNLEKNFLSRAWDKIVNGFDYVEGFLEYAVCGLVGILVGIFDAVVSIVSGIVDIAYGIKHIIGWLISKASGGRFGRESEEKVNTFFKNLGQALGAPLDLISKMWNATVEEAKLIEGPFEECQLAIFWVRRVANIVVNILLLIFAGYGAIKAAIEALEAIKNISTFAEFLSKLGSLPVALLRKLKTLPSSLAAGGRAIVSAIRNVDSIAAAVRKTIGVIRLAAKDQNFWLNLRRASGEFVEGKIQGEKDWWAKRKEVWTASADAEEAKVAKSEELVNTATGEAESNPKAAEQKANQAEDQVVDAQAKAELTEKEVNTGQTAEDRAAKQPPGVISPATEAWEKSLSPDTLKLLEADPELRKFWHDMDPEVRKALTYCASPCIPLQANDWPEVLTQIKGLQQRLKMPGEHIGLREYLHMYRNDRKAMSDALKAVDSITTLRDFEAFLDNELIKTIKAATGVTVRKVGGLWEFPKADGSVIREFEIGTHNALSSRGAENFFQSHHGIQNAWAKERFKGLGVYDEGQAKTLLLRSRNLEGGSRGTPHGIISDLQRQRAATIGKRPFSEELAELSKDLNTIGVPPAIKDQYLTEIQQYFRGIYDTLAKKMTPDELKVLFGDWPK